MRTKTFITAMLLSALATDAVLAQASPETKTKGTDPAATIQAQQTTKPSPQAGEGKGEVLKDWTSADSVAVRYFGPDVGVWPDNAKKAAATFSPDRQYFYVRSFRGDLADDSVVQTVEVYEAAQVKQWLNGSEETPLPPQAMLERRLYTREAGSAMDEMRWTLDSRAITFIGHTVQHQEQIYRLHVPSGRLEQLTDDAYPEKAAYQMQGDSLVYQRERPMEESSGRPYPVVPLPRDAKGDVELNPINSISGYAALRVGGEPWEVPGQRNRQFEAAFSLDAQRAVVLTTDRRSVNGASPVSKFTLVDFTQRRSRELSEVRRASGSKVTPQTFWSPDGASIVLVSTMLPEGVKVDGRNFCPCLASYEPASDRWQILEPMQEKKDGPSTGSGRGTKGEGVLTQPTEKDTPATGGELRRQVESVRGLQETGALLVSHIPESQGVTRYEWKNRRWTATRAVSGGAEMLSGASASAATAATDGLKIQVRQSQNDPPRLVVSDGKREKALSRPDPALEGIWRARVEPFATRTADGMEVKGALSLPRGVQQPLPLVIQIGYDYGMPDLFLPDGTSPSAFARQPLNARGMAVLSIDATGMQQSKKRYTPQEGPGVVDQIDAAVEVLAGKGIIDRTRVGVVGFSRTGYQTFYAVTHPKKTAIAAAEVFDATTFNYVQYLLHSLLGSRETSEEMHAGSFWQNKASWLEHDVLFNADRMEAATLFVEVSGTRRSGQSWEDHSMLNLAKIGALTLTQRPFEMLFMPQGRHVLNLPRQRQASLEATVDWMSFWLLGYEDPASNKSQQYMRWRQIRERNEQRKAAAAKTTSSASPSKTTTSLTQKSSTTN